MIYALHGFLGLPSDWNFLKNYFKGNLEAEDLWQTRLSMKNWAEQKSLELASMPGPRILLGYSMGGRLAMHLLLENPKIWDAAIFVSANPGTANVDERETRKKIDHKWAERFLKEDWQKVVLDWNEQNLFTNKIPARDTITLPRLEKDFSREALAHALENWSLAKQDDLALKLAQVSLPILWLAGEHDEKYCDLLCGFAQIAGSHEFVKVSGAAHRVPWDSPSQFISTVDQFLKANQIL